MGDFNRYMQLLVTVIEGNKTKSFLMSSIDCPWDCELNEFHSILDRVFNNTNFEAIVNEARKCKSFEMEMDPDKRLINELQIKLSDCERWLKEKDREIIELKSKIRE